MDAKRNRNKMLADTNESGYVWTGPLMEIPRVKLKVAKPSFYFAGAKFFNRLPI